jgi:hypothetical protein
MTINDILAYYRDMRAVHSSKRPWAHFRKKGPGRKHQSGKVMTKQERYPA